MSVKKQQQPKRIKWLIFLFHLSDKKIVFFEEIRGIICFLKFFLFHLLAGLWGSTSFTLSRPRPLAFLLPWCCRIVRFHGVFGHRQWSQS